MGKLKVLALLLAILIASAVITAWAVTTFIISPHRIVTVEEYILTLNVNATNCVVGDALKFNGTLTSPSFAYEGATVKLYRNNTYTGLSDLTDETGYYEMLYLTTTIGAFDFYANATITS